MMARRAQIDSDNNSTHINDTDDTIDNSVEQRTRRTTAAITPTVMTTTVHVSSQCPLCRSQIEAMVVLQRDQVEWALNRAIMLNQ